MRRRTNGTKLHQMPRYLVRHRHAREECRFAFAAWKGFESPLRHAEAMSTCEAGDHSIWWEVEAPTEEAALEQLPPYVAERSEAIAAKEVPIP
jgi:hypothetical protein